MLSCLSVDLIYYTTAVIVSIIMQNKWDGYSMLSVIVLHTSSPIGKRLTVLAGTVVDNQLVDSVTGSVTTVVVVVVTTFRERAHGQILK